jgi:hypothetical protein
VRSWEAQIFFYFPDGIGGNEKADGKKEEDEEERKAEVGFYSRRCSSSHW